MQRKAELWKQNYKPISRTITNSVKESERRSAQLTHRLDQMERQLREQDLQLEQLRQRLLQVLFSYII